MTSAPGCSVPQVEPRRDIRDQRPRKPPSNHFGAFSRSFRKNFSPQKTGSVFYAFWGAFLHAQMQFSICVTSKSGNFFLNTISNQMQETRTRSDLAHTRSRFGPFRRFMSSPTRERHFENYLLLYYSL